MKIDRQNQRASFEEAFKVMLNSSEHKSTYMFYAHMISHCKIIFDSEMKAPAGVNYQVNTYNLFINPEEFGKFTLIQRLGVLKHEMLHILFNHVGRKEDRNHEIMNIASDTALNQSIVREHLPDGCLFPDVIEKEVNKLLKEQGKPSIKVPSKETTEFYYDLIKDIIPKKEQDGSGEGSGDSDSDSDSDGEGSGDQEGQEGQGNGLKPMDDHSKWKESSGDETLRKNITKKMIQTAMGQTAKNAGNNPQEIEHFLDLFTEKAVVSWKKELKNLVGSKRVGRRPTIMRKNRRFPGRDDIKGTTKDLMYEVVVCLDISGSMSDAEVIKGLTEVKEICRVSNSGIKIIQIDTEIHEVSDFTAKQTNFNRSGCGGTYMGAGMTYIKENRIENDLVILITDGYIEDISTWDHPPKRLMVLCTTKDLSIPGIEAYGNKYKQFDLMSEM